MSSQRAPTIATVAKAAGVGVSTVSRVLNGGYVSDSLEAKVRRAMHQLDYTPSAAARNLKLNKTGIVGLVAATSQAPWMSVFLSGVEKALAGHDASVALCSLEMDGRYSTEVARHWIEDKRVDSLIFVRATSRERLLVELAQTSEIPHVHVSPDVEWSKAALLRADNVTAGKTAAEHLLGHGHREFLYLAGPQGSTDSHRRLTGLRDALHQAELCLPDERILFGQGYDVDSGVAAARLYLEDGSLRDVTAIVAASDAIALGFQRTVLAAGLRLPEDLSLVGFDDVPAAELVWPGLSTVAQPVDQMGMDAATRLLSGTAADAPVALYPTRLVARQSSGPVPLQSR